MTSRPQPVEQDSRGILDPAQLLRQVRFNRYPAGPELAGLVEWFWAVSWDLPDGTRHSQQVLTHPGANLSVGTGSADLPEFRADRIEARCNGVATRLSTRVLAGRGWTVAALATPGGLGAFITAPAATFTDRVIGLGEAMKVDEQRLLLRSAAAESEHARVALLAEALVAALTPERAEPARQVAAVAALAQRDRTLRTLADLAAATGIGPRTLQRQFREHAGVSPTWVLRRYRLLDVAETVRDGRPANWSDVAVALGYADQAHLIRDFRAATGQTPAAYAQTLQSPTSPPD